VVTSWKDKSKGKLFKDLKFFGKVTSNYKAIFGAFLQIRLVISAMFLLVQLSYL